MLFYRAFQRGFPGGCGFATYVYAETGTDPSDPMGVEATALIQTGADDTPLDDITVILQNMT